MLNKTNETKTIAEQSLGNLAIPFESLEQSTKIDENTYLKYPKEGFGPWKKINISFSEIKDNTFRKKSSKK